MRSANEKHWRGTGRQGAGEKGPLSVFQFQRMRLQQQQAVVSTRVLRRTAPGLPHPLPRASSSRRGASPCFVGTAHSPRSFGLAAAPSGLLKPFMSVPLLGVPNTSPGSRQPQGLGAPPLPSAPHPHRWHPTLWLLTSGVFHIRFLNCQISATCTNQISSLETPVIVTLSCIILIRRTQ